MKFRAHETFHIRKGWLNKGLYNVINEPGVFLGDVGNPMDVMGIGSNMVKSLRYWLQAAGLTEEPTHGKRNQSLTELGQVIYDNDPFFEEIGSLWLVHYMIASNEEDATSWYLFFNEFDHTEFTEEDFYSRLRKYVKMIDPEKMPADRAIYEDFRCVMGTYVKRTRSNGDKSDPEDNMECPLTELGLIDTVSGSAKNKYYRKINPKIESIPELIALAIIIKNANEKKEIKISSILSDKKGLGKTMNLDTITLINILYKLDNLGYLKVVRTAGLDIIKLSTDMSFIDCVKKYYEELNA